MFSLAMRMFGPWLFLLVCTCVPTLTWSRATPSPPQGATCEVDQSRLTQPGSGTYPTAAFVYNQKISSFPSYIYQPNTPEDVASAICWAKSRGLRPVARSGGHSYSGYSTCQSDCVVIDVSGFHEVSFDSETKYAKIGAGVRTLELANALQSYGVTVVKAVCGHTSVTGPTLGGGFGPLCDSRGLAIDNLVSVDLVLSNGTFVTASDTSHPDLFWALRGGGHESFGIVTSITMQTHDLGIGRSKFQYLQHKIKDGATADAILHWQKWATKADPYKVTFARLTLGNSQGRVDNHNIFTVYNGTWDEATSAVSEAFDNLTDLVACHAPNNMAPANCRDLTWNQVVSIMANCGYETWVAFTAHSRFSPRLLSQTETNALVEEFEAISETSCSPVWAFVDIDRFGGAVSKVAPNATAFPHRNMQLMLQFQVQRDATLLPNQDASCSAWVNQLYQRMGEFLGDEAFPNYDDSTLRNWQKSYYGDNYPRLQQVKKVYDPKNFMRFPQGIELPAEQTNLRG